MFILLCKLVLLQRNWSNLGGHAPLNNFGLHLVRVVNLVFHLVAAGSLRCSQVARERKVSLLNGHDVEGISSTAQAA